MPKIFVLSTLYLLLLTMIPLFSGAQSDQNVYPHYGIDEKYHFRHLTSENGLPANYVFEVMKDSQGFIWIATRSGGLCRYDGYSIKVYQNDPSDSTSISDNHIGSDYKNRIVEDADGNLWIATLSGLNKFDPNTETFKRYLHDPGDSSSIIKNSILCLYIDKTGILWIGIGEGGGLMRYNKDKDNFTLFKSNPADTNWQVKSVLSIYEDRTNVLWVGGYDGLYQFDRKQESFMQMFPDSIHDSDTVHNPIIMIYEDDKGTLYFGTPNGLMNYDTIIKSLIPFEPFYDIINFNIYNLDMLEDPVFWDQSLWIIAWNLYKFDKMTGHVTGILHDPRDPSSIRGNSLSSIYRDESGILWVTGEFGINILDPYLNQIREHPGFGAKYGDAMSFMEDSEGHLWIGTHKQLVHFDQNMNVVEQIDSLPVEKEQETFYGLIWSICEDSDQNLWVGTEYDGLYLREKGSAGFVRCNFSGTEKDIPVFVWNIFEDSQGVVWVATLSYGLYQRKKDEYPLTNFYNDSLKTVFQNVRIPAIYEDRSGNLWIATRHKGLFLQTHENRGTYEFINFRYDPEDHQSLSSDWIWSVYEDEFNNIWVATENGLNKYVTETNTFERYINSNDVSANVIYNLTGDDKGHLWLVTEGGLIRFESQNIDANESINFVYKQYLEFNDIIPYKIYKSKNGWIFVGGTFKSGKGYYAFHPDSIRENRDIPPIVISDFKVRNEHLQLDTGISRKTHISLKHSQNFFSFEFSALDYSEPEKNQFAYMLEGIEDNWIYSGNQRSANYTNIPPGSYVFKVKGSNNDGFWNEKGTSILITILPPPWKTWWAYSIYGLLVLGLIFAWRKYDLKHQRLKQELEIEHIEAEKLKELDSLKSSFFANISHEFRTPLTLIIGPIQKLFSKTSDEETKQELNIMQRNARRLQKLINQLLDLSKLESGKMKLKTREENVVILIKSYVHQFESMAKQKRIELVFKVGAETAAEKKDLEIPVYVDRDKLEKILYNLLSNAFKFTPEGGRIEVQVDQTSQVTYHKLCPPKRSGGGSHIASLLISISDTGSGIPPEKLPHIFDRFYQADDSYTNDQEGTGIGLTITKELVEMHHGHIEVKSKVGVGTTFRIYLPLGQNHLKPDQIDSSRQSAVDPPSLRFGGQSSRQSGVGFGDEEFGDEKIGDGMKIEEPGTWNLEPGTGGEKRIILLVEDNADLRIYIRSYLDQTYGVIEAKDGKQGLSLAIEHIPDLIISDVMMPKMDGLELCDKLKTDERTSHIPIILLTARAGMESKIEGLETGADDFITKPFDPEELMVRIRNLIEQRKKLQAKFLKKVRKLGLEQMLELENDELTSMDQRLLQKVTTYIIENLSETDLSVESLGSHTALSTRQLHRKIVALTGDTPNRLIRSIRLHRAAELLRSKTGNVTEIAFEVGFNSLSWFAKCFKEEFGVLPSDFADSEIA